MKVTEILFFKFIRLIKKKKESVPMLKYIFADMGNTTKYLDSTISHLFDKQHRCYTE